MYRKMKFKDVFKGNKFKPLKGAPGWEYTYVKSNPNGICPCITPGGPSEGIFYPEDDVVLVSKKPRRVKEKKS